MNDWMIGWMDGISISRSQDRGHSSWRSWKTLVEGKKSEPGM